MWGCFAGFTRKTPPHTRSTTQSPKEPVICVVEEPKYLPYQGTELSHHFGKPTTHIMKKWNLGIEDPGAFTIAADVRGGGTNYTNDHIWDVRLPGGEPLALDIRTSFGLRARGFRIFPRFVEGDTALTDPREFAKPAQVQRIYPNFLEVSFSPFTGIDIRYEYWVPKSQILSGRMRVTNRRLTDRKIRVEIIALLAPTGGGEPMATLEMEGAKVLCGRTNGIFPLVFMTGVPKINTGPYPALAVDLDLPPGASRDFTWVHTAQADPKGSLELARDTSHLHWEAETARLAVQNEGLIEIETGDPDWDAAFALAQKTAYSLLVGPTGYLPYPSFVFSRQADHGYSNRGDGTDYGHLWNGQTPLEADYLSTFLLPATPDLAKGLLLNFLETQTQQGFVDWKPGLGGQRGRMMATPILTHLAWRIFETTEDRTFLKDVYPKLLSFVQAWFTNPQDRDGDGLPEWSRASQSGFEDHPTFSQWEEWAQGADISKVESPALCALLYNEIQQLVKIAGVLEQTGPISALLALADNLKSAIEFSWDGSASIYRNWDRETHFSPGGEVLHTQFGTGEIRLDREFERPVRLHLRVIVAGELPRQMAFFIHGTGASGTHRVEKIVEDQFRWNLERGNACSEQVYTAVEYIQISGLNEQDQISIQVMDLSGLDHTLLLPLWAGIPDQERAFELIKQTITNPDFFWKTYGISACPPEALDDNHPCQRVHMIWNSLIGTGLVTYGYYEEAANLVTRLMTSIIQNLKQNNAFYNYYHAGHGRGIGELNAVGGLAPLKLFLDTVGIQIISSRKIKVSGENPYPWEVNIRYRGLSVTKHKSKTVVTFPGGQTAVINTPEPRIVKVKNQK